MNMITDALADPTINKFGLYGLPCVGKSTMVCEIADKPQGKFDPVVIMVVARNPDYKEIKQKLVRCWVLNWKKKLSLLELIFCVRG